MKKILLLLVLAGAGSPALWSTQNSAKVAIISQMAGSEDPEQKLSALSLVREQFSTGRLSRPEEEDLIGIVGSLAREGIVFLSYDSRKVGNNHTQVRLEANRILRTIGNPGSYETVLDILENEPLSYILSVAVETSGEIGEVTEELEQLYYNILTGRELRFKDELLVSKTMGAIEALKEKDEAILLSDRIRGGLIYVFNPMNGCSRRLRDQAGDILKN